MHCMVAVRSIDGYLDTFPCEQIILKIKLDCKLQQILRTQYGDKLFFLFIFYSAQTPISIYSTLYSYIHAQIHPISSTI